MCLRFGKSNRYSRAKTCLSLPWRTSPRSSPDQTTLATCFYESGSFLQTVNGLLSTARLNRKSGRKPSCTAARQSDGPSASRLPWVCKTHQHSGPALPQIFGGDIRRRVRGCPVRHFSSLAGGG